MHEEAVTLPSLTAALLQTLIPEGSFIRGPFTARLLTSGWVHSGLNYLYSFWVIMKDLPAARLFLHFQRMDSHRLNILVSKEESPRGLRYHLLPCPHLLNMRGSGSELSGPWVQILSRDSQKLGTKFYSAIKKRMICKHSNMHGPRNHHTNWNSQTKGVNIVVSVSSELIYKTGIDSQTQKI